MGKRRCFLFLLLLAASAYAQQTVRIGYFYLEPFTIEKAGAKDPVGVSVDYWEKLIAPAMGVKTEWVGPFPIARMYQSLDIGEIDAIFIMVPNPDRLKKYLFPSKPYSEAHPCIWTLKKNPLSKITRVEDLYDTRIGFVEGSVINPFLDNDRITIENAQGEGYKKMNFDKLLAGRLDAIYDHNEFTLAYEARTLGIADKVKVTFLPLDPTPFYVAFAKTERGAALLKLYEPVNNSVVRTDAVRALVKKYTGM